MMSTNGVGREELLERYGRFYGDEHFAVAFTAAIAGDDAKRVTTNGWDTTPALAGGNFAAGLIKNRGKTRNPVIVLRPSNLIILECDTEEDLVRIDTLDLPETVTVRSSADYKRHFWYRPPADLETLPYVAFRFESGKLTADSGRYFLAPPSVHPSGQIYSFLPGRGPGELPIAAFPAETYRHLAEQARRESSEQRDQIRIDPDAKVRAGNRRDILFRYACMQRRWGLSRREIADATHAYNDARCDPPVERHLVEVQIDGAMKKEGDQEIQRALDRPLEDEPEAPPTVDARQPWVPINLSQLPDQPPIEPTLGRVGLVYPGKRHVFSGPQESAKTLAAYAIGIHVVRDGGTVLIIDFEMGAWDARNRLRELGASPTEIARMPYIEPYEPAKPATMTALAQTRPQLVIIDAAAGAYSLQGLDDNNRGDVETLTRLYIHSFWQAGIATIMLDHVVKNTDARGKYAIGSERKTGGADVHLGFETISPIQRGTNGLYKIVTHKDRGGFLQRGKLADLELASDPATHEISWTFRYSDAPAPEFRPTYLMERISVWLQLQPEACSRNKIETSVNGNSKAKRAAIDVLLREGFAQELDGPHGAKLVTSRRPYRQNDPACNPEEHPTSSTSSTSSNLVSSSSRRSPPSSSDLVPPLQGDERQDSPADEPSSSNLDDDWPFDDEPEPEPPPGLPSLG